MHFSDTLTDATSAVTSANASALAIRQVFEGGDNQVITMPDGTERNSVAKDVRERLDGLETQAMVFRDQAFAAADSIGPIQFYDTRAAADLDMTNLSEGDIVEVTTDESLGGSRVRYRVEDGVYVRKVVLSGVVPGSTTLETAEVLAAGGVIPPGTVLPVFYNGIIFDVRVEDDADALNPLGSRLRPLPPLNVKMWGATGDGITDDHAACQAAAAACPAFRSAVGGGNDTAVAGSRLGFPLGVYNFNGKRITLPNFVTPVCPDGDAIIKQGGILWAGSIYGMRIANFRFVDPPSRWGPITNVSISGTVVTITSPGHGLADDDFVRLRGVSGTHEANGRGDRITNVTTDTFELATWDGSGWTAFSPGEASAAEWREGAAIEYKTGNVSRTTMAFENIIVYGAPDQRQAAIICRDYHATRSTALSIRNCAFAGISKFLYAPVDGTVIDNCFGWQEDASEATFYLRGKATFLGGVYVPRDASAFAHWIDYDVGREPAGVNGFLSLGTRWSGEVGGISIVRTLATGSTLQGSAGNLTNPSSITFRDCYIAAGRGGRAENDGGIVILGRGSSDGAWVPNRIIFEGCASNVNPTASADAWFVRTEIDGAPPALTEDYNFGISIDAASRGVTDRHNAHPVPDNLLPHLDAATRASMMARHQVIQSSPITTPDVLKGATIELIGGGTNRTIDHLQNTRPGDRITLIAREGTAVNWIVPHDANTTTRFLLAGGVDFDPSAPAALSLLILGNDDAQEIGRS